MPPLKQASAPATAPGRRIGLLGGSFNPVHEGHMHISRLALERLGLDEVWWLVSPQNPLKATDGMAPLDERLAGAKAFVDDSRIIVTDLERWTETRYTADTLDALRRQFPDVRFVWLMGADNLCQVHRWYSWSRIFNSVPVAVFARPSYSLKARSSRAARRFARNQVKSYRAKSLADMRPPAWALLRTPLNPASATKIRARKS